MSNESRELFDPAARAAQVRGKLIARRAPAFDTLNRLRIFAIEARLGADGPKEAYIVFKLNSRSFTTAAACPGKDGVCRWGAAPGLAVGSGAGRVPLHEFDVNDDALPGSLQAYVFEVVETSNGGRVGRPRGLIEVLLSGCAEAGGTEIELDGGPLNRPGASSRPPRGGGYPQQQTSKSEGTGNADSGQAEMKPRVLPLPATPALKLHAQLLRESSIGGTRDRLEQSVKDLCAELDDIIGVEPEAAPASHSASTSRLPEGDVVSPSRSEGHLQLTPSKSRSASGPHMPRSASARRAAPDKPARPPQARSVQVLGRRVMTDNKGGYGSAWDQAPPFEHVQCVATPHVDLPHVPRRASSARRSKAPSAGGNEVERFIRENKHKNNAPEMDDYLHRKIGVAAASSKCLYPELGLPSNPNKLPPRPSRRGPRIRISDGQAVLEADDNCLRDIVRNHYQTLTTAFRVFDSDGDGLVSFAEFKHGLGLAGLSGLPDERVEQLWRVADEGDLGFLSMAQLAAFLKV
jgi:hypothetical protein